MLKRAGFFLNRLGERLWIKPVLMGFMSVVVVLAAGFADGVATDVPLPRISEASVISLLKVLSSGMLVIATLAVASMVTSYNSASTSATPRAFPLVVSDDLSQFALSTFVGAFIFSVITLVAVENAYYQRAGLFVVMVITLVVFTLVILTFIRWVDGIARLGLLSNTIEKVEKVTESAMRERLRAPTMGGIELEPVSGCEVFADSIGYLQLVDMDALQRAAESAGVRISIISLPGRLIIPGRGLATVCYANGGGQGGETRELEEGLERRIRRAFVIGAERTFDEDPRFGLVALSQIACRALSPAINDPGTAIDIIATFVRLLTLWCEGDSGSGDSQVDEKAVMYPQVAVPRLNIDDMLDDAFGAIARDGAGNVEVARRLQTAFASLISLENPGLTPVARKHAEIALKRAESALTIEQDMDAVRSVFREQ